MPLPFAFLRLPLAAALACAFAAGSAAASDHGASHDAAPAAKAKGEAKADVKAAVQADAKPAARGAAAVKDPLDIVRERLAEKLGATKPLEAPNRNVLRVVSRASTTESAPAKVAAGHGHGDDDHAPAARPRLKLAAAAPHGTKLAMADPHAAPAIPAAPMPAHWDYQGAGGPESWGAMKPEFSKCSSGTRQSPIDIRDGIKVQLDTVQFDYKPTSFRVLDNGHTVQVNVGGGNSIEVGGRRFDLLQFHFHRPSEERVNGRQFEMVAHLVHKDLEGRLAVVAVLLDRGAAQPLIQAVWNNLPLEKGEENAAQTPIDLNALLPPERSYYTYMGSLTTPPCSEGVLWMVMKTPVPVSPQQIAIFSKLYPMNARPVQASAGRLIKESN